MKNEDVCQHFGKNLKTASGIYGNPIEIPVIKNNQFRVLRSLKFGKNDWFWYFCEDSKLLREFSSWYVAWLYFSLRLLAKFEFSARRSN